MGNRAVIATKEKDLGVYLHWNGGRDSVEAFLEYCKIKGYRAPEQDNYGWARLAQVIGNFFGGDTSIGIDRYERLDTDNYDNGTYIIENWKIVGREFVRGDEQREHSLNEMLVAINEAQPTKEQIPSEYLEAQELLTNQLIVGDKVFIRDFTGKIELHEVIGIGKNEVINGRNVGKIPYTNRYNKDNVNAYMWESSYKVIR